MIILYFYIIIYLFNEHNKKVMKISGHMVRINAYVDFNTIFKILVSRFGQVYYNLFTQDNSRKVGVILGEKFFLRTASYAAITILLEEIDDKKCQLDIISHAGGEGFLDISYGSHPSYVYEVLKFIENNNILYEKIMEIDYMSGGKVPPDIQRKITAL